MKPWARTACMHMQQPALHAYAAASTFRLVCLQPWALTSELIFLSPGNGNSCIISGATARLPACCLVVCAGTVASPNYTICGLNIINSGNVGLDNITVIDQTPHCPVILSLAPGESHACNMSRAVSQADFDAWDADGTRVSLSVHITAMPAGTFETAQISNTTAGTTVLVSRPGFTATAVPVTPDNVQYAGEHRQS